MKARLFSLDGLINITCCVIFVILWPGVALRKQIPSDRPKHWLNPCGLKENSSLTVKWTKPSPSQLKATFQLMDANITKVRLWYEKFRTEYVEKTFQVDYEKHHNDWKNQRYDWLPVVPKELGVQTPEAQLVNLQPKDFLRQSAVWLEGLMIALEQVVWDWGLESEQEGLPHFLHEFYEVYTQVDSLLCEVTTLMKKIGYPRNSPEPHRSIMPSELRDLDETQRDLRDWIIFREYMTLMEFMSDSVKYFLSHPEKFNNQ